MGACLHYTKNWMNDCLFFECSKFRTSAHESLLSRYRLKASLFCLARVVGTASAYVGVVCESSRAKKQIGQPAQPGALWPRGTEC
jgi:hypothetical protein